MALIGLMGIQASTVVSGDVNNDGKDDLVTTFPDIAPCAEVMLSNGDGTFKPPLGYTGTTPCGNFSLYDMNRDGNLDLLVTDNGGSAILIGAGNGRFQGHMIYGTGGNAHSMCVADFNGDGYPDVAVLNTDTNDIAVLYNNGDGTLQYPVMFSFPDGALAITAGDLNRDGKSELVVAEPTGASVLLGSAAGLQNPVHYSANVQSASSCAIADLNHDGNLDVVVAANLGSSQLIVFAGNGDGTLAQSSIIPFGDTVVSMMTGDMNEDGYLDVVANCRYTLRVVVGMQDPGPALGSTAPDTGNWAVRFAGVGQMDLLGGTNVSTDYGDFGTIPGNSHLDLVYPNYLQIYCGDGTGNFPLQTTSNFGIGSPTIADMNLDGLPDVVGVDGSLLDIAIGSGVPAFNSPPLQFSLMTAGYQVLVADMNQDGKPDVVVLHSLAKSIGVLLRK